MVRCLFFLKKRHLTAHNKTTGFSTLPKFSVKLFFSSCLLHLHSTSSFLSTETEWVFLHCLLTWHPFTCDIFLSNLLLLLYICIYLFKSFILGSDVYSVNVETWLWRFIITLLILFLNCAVVLYIVFLLCVFYILNFRTVVGNKWLWISCTFSPLLFSTVLNYTFEGDAERRKERLPPRIDFLGPSGGQVELKGQRREACTDTKLRLLVKLVSSISSRTVLSICSNP